MGNITKNEMAGAQVNDNVELAGFKRTKTANEMWKRDVANTNTLETTITTLKDGASSDMDTFKEVETNFATIKNDLNNIYNKSEVDTLVSNVSAGAANLTAITTNIIPATGHVLELGSPTNRFKTIYVDEAMLSANTLYIDGVPVLGTSSDTIVVKADPDQSLLVKTSGTGSTIIQSGQEVQVSTNGMNADVKIQATGTNSKVRLGGTGGVEVSSPLVTQSDLSVSGNFTLTGNLIHNGGSFVTNATTVTTKDNIIVLNQGEVGTGVTAGKAGIQVDRGEDVDFQLIFNEVTDKFTVGTVGGIHETLATREYVDAANLNKVDKIIGKQLSTEDYTTAEKTKLASLNNYTLPTATDTVVGGIKIGSGLSINNGVVSVNDGGTADSVNWSGVQSKPTTLAGYGITDASLSTHTHANATTTTAGLMASTDKTKLDGIAASANNYVKPANEPISYITGLQTALDSKTTSADVSAAIQAVVGAAPAALDTLQEIAAQLASDESAVSALTTTVSNKVDKVAGKQLSTEDYTTAEKTKLAGIATGANNYVLPTATSSAIGGIKVSATAQTVAANAVTTTASRTYAVQIDASGNALVNVPWVDTNTIYTHPTSGATAGTYKSVTVDANGHITAGTNPTTLAGYGITDAATSAHNHNGTYEPIINAGTTSQYLRGDKTWQAMPTALPASDVYAWAKAATKPVYTAAEVGALGVSGGTLTGALTAIRETRVNMAANNIDLSAGNLFTKTITAATTFTINGALASGNANSFILELTNGGSNTITWWSGVKWPGGVAPTLTASGVDILGFYSHDGGVTWRGFISKDSK